MKFSITLGPDRFHLVVPVHGTSFVEPAAHAIDCLIKETGRRPTHLTLTQHELGVITDGSQYAKIIEYTGVDPGNPTTVLQQLFGVQAVEVVP